MGLHMQGNAGSCDAHGFLAARSGGPATTDALSEAHVFSRILRADSRLPERDRAWRAVWKSNIQYDFNVRVFEWFDTSTSAVLRELAESNRFVQKSAESTSI